MIADMDKAALRDYLIRRDLARSAGRDSLAAYWAGRVDGHCLQNAITALELAQLSAEAGVPFDWTSALDVPEAQL